jgi:response regulator NasT
MNRDCPRPVLMCSPDSDSGMIRRAVKAGVSSYVIDSVSPERLDALVEVAVAQFEAFQNLRAERDDATRKLSERITIDRAKGVLMRARGLDEDGAYHALRKLAMERGRKLADVAQDVIEMAKLLL